YLQRHLAAYGLGLLGQEDDAEAALADLLQQLVWADDRARPLAAGRPVGGFGRGFEETAHLLMRLEQTFDMPLQRRSARTGAIQVGRPPVRVGEDQGGVEDLAFVHGGHPWGSGRSALPPYSADSVCVLCQRKREISGPVTALPERLAGA